MKLRFPAAVVRRLVEHTLAAPAHQALYEDEATKAPGLWLVGDQGVYLMSNGEPGLKDGDKNVVAMARECDPDTLPFDEWWAAKGASFGGDDGAEFLAIPDFQLALKTGMEHVIMEVDSDGIGVYVDAEKATPPA